MTSGGWQVLAVLARAGGFAALVPTLGLGDGAVKHRVILALLLFLILFSVAAEPASSAAPVNPIGPILAGLASGGLIGFAVRSLLAGITMTGQLVEHQLGFSLFAEADEDAGGAAIHRLYQITAATVFFTLGGHRLVIASLMDSGVNFDWATVTANDVVELAVGLVWNPCWLALHLAAPLILALLAASLAVGMIGRVVPHPSGSSIALPAQIAFGLVLLLLSLAALVPAIRDELKSALNWLH